MASFQEVELLTPNGKTDKVLQIKTGNESDAYRLPDLVHEVGSYTFVIWLKSDKACTVNFSILGNTYQANVTTEWTKHVQKVKIENLTNKNIDIAPSQNTTTYYYEAFLAKGEIDTSWIPAPEDADANFSRVYSEIKQTAEGIEQNVVSNVDKKISSINLTIEGITQRVSDAEQGVSEVKQKAGIIESSVSSLEGDVSKIKQQSDQVVIQVGNSIKSTVEEFYQSDSPTTLRGGYWSESQPTWTEGKYLWRRTKVTKGNNNVSYTPSENGVCITGNTGASGDEGNGTGGSINLLLKSNTANRNASPNAYPCAIYDISKPLIANETYTATISGYFTNAYQWAVYIGGTTYGTDFQRVESNGDKTLSITFVCTQQMANANRTLNICVRDSYSTSSAGNAHAYIDWAKLENTGKSSPYWFPAPEDVDDKINNAQNQANQALEQAKNANSSITVLNNSIQNLVTDKNGSSLMTQTSNGWTFNMSSVQSQIDEAIKDIASTDSKAETAKNLASKTEQLANDIAKKTAYINMSTDDNGSPCIELGKSDEPFKLRITNKSIDFMQGTNRIAYITNQKLYIQSSVVTDQMQIGDDIDGFAWKKRGNGNLGLRRVKYNNQQSYNERSWY